MNKKIIKVPNGIEYISQWNGYKIPRGEHCIVDKGVTGCGYTELALCNEDPIVLCSPRKLLLENKSEKHYKEKHYNILYLDSLTQDSIMKRVENHLKLCKELRLPPKFLVTYDSTGKIVSCLKKFGILNDFIFVVDEFQSVFLDSYFKVGIEFDFVNNLQECTSVVYLSATPMLDKYLDKLKEFKDLVFYKLDWSNSGFVETIFIGRKRTKSLTQECCKIVNDYLRGKFPMILNKNDKIVSSREAVFYFNSIKEIIRVISKCGLTMKNTSVICSKTDNNRSKLKRIGFTFGKIPLEDEPNPIFTFCTSAVYMGVDFYSDCASSYVFADPNVSCLSLDISLDLPQIIGRQRKKTNPFKNYISLFYKTVRNNKLCLTEENFRSYLEFKRERTRNLLNIYNKVSEEEKIDYLDKLRSDIEYSNYSKDFVSISERTGEPVYNPLIDIADQRAWEVSQKDYQDHITVTKAIGKIKDVSSEIYDSWDENIVNTFLKDQFYTTNIFSERLKLYCNFRDAYSENEYILNALEKKMDDNRFDQCYRYFGTSGCKAKNYKYSELERVFSDVSKDDLLLSEIYSKFSVGDRYLFPDIKNMLKKLYDGLGLFKSPKATDIKDYFEVSKTNITTQDGIKKGYKLLRRLL